MQVALVACLLVCVCAVESFLFNAPCDVVPNGTLSDHEFTVNVTVPNGCKNGTFHWDYPKGHANPYTSSAVVVCFQDRLGGEIFTIIDKADGSTINVNGGDSTWKCASPTSELDIVFQIDAPDTTYYMAEIGYKLSSQ